MTAGRPGRGARRHPTMSEVAELAGVSQTTVSFVVNRLTDAGIPEETRARVWAAVKQLGYRPNAAAKLLRTNRSHSVGFLTDVVASSPFAGEIVRGAQEAAWLNKHLLIIVNTGGDPSLEEAAVELLLERRVEGIIYASMAHRAVRPPANLREVPAVLLNCFCADRSLPSVVPDEVGGGRVATEVLLGKGHRRIGFINMDLDPAHPPARGRLDGYRHALAAHGVGFDASLVRDGNSFADDGYRYARELMGRPEPPTALFCGTDRTAMGAYDALRELGFAVPGDVAVMGFDDQQLIAAYLRPPLSTMALPFYEMGEWAARALTDHGDDPDPMPAVQHTIACPYVERAST